MNKKQLIVAWRRIRKFFALLLCLGLVGCATVDPNYYTNPNSPGYSKQALGGLCEKCNRVFNYSGLQYNTLENIQCPYCGHVQNLKMASNRYAYLKQQKDAQEAQIRTQNIFNTYQNYQNKQTEAQQQYYNNLQNYYSQQISKRSTTKCRQIWDGSIQCDTY